MKNLLAGKISCSDVTSFATNRRRDPFRKINILVQSLPLCRKGSNNINVEPVFTPKYTRNIPKAHQSMERVFHMIQVKAHQHSSRYEENHKNKNNFIHKRIFILNRSYQLIFNSEPKKSCLKRAWKNSNKFSNLDNQN